MPIGSHWQPRSLFALIGVVVSASASTSLAQSSNGSADPNGTQNITRGLTNPKNGGVAGTGMGGTSGQSGTSTANGGSGKAPGTGMSVTGPAGAGINGSSDTSGMKMNGDGTTGSGGTGASGSGSGTKPVGQ